MQQQDVKAGSSEWAKMALSAPIPAPGPAPTLGPKSAPVRLLLFSDSDCPYCAEMEAALRREIPRYGPEVRLEFRNFPLPGHEGAFVLARLGYCVFAQNPSEFWRFQDFVLANSSAISSRVVRENLPEQFVEDHSRLDVGEFGACARSLASWLAVKSDLKFAESLGVRVAPTLFVGNVKIEGSVPAEKLDALIERELRATGGRK